MQRLANVMNHPMHPNPEAEASIRGAAIFVLEKLGLPILPLKKSRPIRPQKKAALEYRQDREKISKLERVLTDNVS
jgi:gluconokinase